MDIFTIAYYTYYFYSMYTVHNKQNFYMHRINIESTAFARVQYLTRALCVTVSQNALHSTWPSITSVTIKSETSCYLVNKW